ncbi:MAG TPA: hypothetical protein VKQ36_04985 [Ktedonobacterales bacterium]|nr:hypothetical protein [Ktedonobacterales bacterium]
MPRVMYSQPDSIDDESYLIGLDVANADDGPAPPKPQRRAPQRRERLASLAQRTHQQTQTRYRERTGKHAKSIHRVGAPRLARQRIGLLGWLRRLTLTALILACLATALGLPAWALTSPTWRVRHIIIQGTTDPSVITFIQQLPLTGCDIFLCHLAHDERLIDNSPLIARASLAPRYPDSLVVSVSLRRPVLRWRVDAVTLAIGADGMTIGVVRPDDALAADPTQHVGALPEVVAVGLNSAQVGQISQIDENVIVMATQLRLPVIAGLLGVSPQALTLTYHWDSSQGFEVAPDGGPHILFGGPDAAAALTQELATSRGAGISAPTGESPNSQQVAQGARWQLVVLRVLLASLAQTGQRVTLIDLRWGAYPYYVVAH